MSNLDHENDLKRRVAEYLSALCEEIVASGQTLKHRDYVLFDLW